jgi:hypothetical protein
MGGHGNFAFNLVIKLSVELGYVFLSQVHHNFFKLLPFKVSGYFTRVLMRNRAMVA